MWFNKSTEMIDLQQLKEQLKLLGHNLPEDQIKDILQEMNIEYAGEGAQGEWSGPELGRAPVSLLQLSCITTF